MKIGFIGNGWRTEGYWKIVRQMPDVFEISGVLFRNAEKAAAYNAKYPGKAYTDLDTFLELDHDFIMMLIPRRNVLEYLEKIVAKGFPVLLETPPCNGLEELNKVYELKKKYDAKIQVAEQYFLQPYNHAVLSICEQGYLGKISNVRVNFAHDYHGISVMRKLLKDQGEPCTITAQKFNFPVLWHCGRNGLDTTDTEKIVNDGRKIANFVYDDGRVGFFDFADEQYFNYFRSRHLQVQGTHGEIVDNQVVYMNEAMHPVTSQLMRQDLGLYSNLEGYSHRGMLFNGQIIYQSPFAKYPDVRLNDDEIAMGNLLLGMDEYVKTGVDIYSLEDALQDTYLYLKMDEAIATGAPVRTERQPWNQE